MDKQLREATLQSYFSSKANGTFNYYCFLQNYACASVWLYSTLRYMLENF